MKKITLFCLINTLFVSFIFPLTGGMFANPGESLIIVEGLYDSEDIEGGTITQYLLGGSYVLNNGLELGGGLRFGNADSSIDEQLDYDISGYSVGGYYHMKESKDLPINIKIGGYYQSLDITGNFINYLEDFLSDYGYNYDITAGGTATSFGGGIYKDVSSSDDMIMMAFADFSVINSEIKIIMGPESETTNDSYNSMGIGLSIRKGNMFVSPYIGQTDGENQFNVSVGFLLPQN